MFIVADRFNFFSETKGSGKKTTMGGWFSGEILSVSSALNSCVTGSLERLKLQLTITNQFQTLTLTD